MNSDGSGQTRLTDNPAHDSAPSLSPDGTRIAFTSQRDGDPDIYTMNADGSDQKKLTSKPGNYSPSWSPDGQKIAFDSRRDFDEEVYVMNADGSSPVNLTNNAPINDTFGLAPLPQSELNLDEIPYKIVYESYRETDGIENWEICQIDANGSNFINLTNTPNINEMYPHASPDGRQICFETVEGKDKESKSRNVYVMNIDGSERTKIAANANQPCWSSDGRYIAYLPGEFPKYNPEVDANKGLEIYDLETGEVTRHPNEEISHIWCLNWSPDREWFVAAGPPIRAYKADDKTRIDLKIPGCTPDINPDGKQLAWNGTNPSLWIGNLDFDSPQSIVTDQRVVVACDRKHWIFHSDWSPDKKYIIFSHIPLPGSDQIGRPAPGSNICICDLRTDKWAQITTDGKHNKEPDWVPVQVRRP
jgi:Tol biopolymer transport system component